MIKQPIISYYVPEVCRLIAEIRHRHAEHCIIISLDQQLTLLAVRTITSQSSSQVRLDIRGILHQVIDQTTASLIIIHNHPSGTVFPSSADYQATFQLLSLGDLLGFSITDHLIVTSTDYFSFAESGVIDELKNPSA